MKYIAIREARCKLHIGDGEIVVDLNGQQTQWFNDMDETNRQMLTTLIYETVTKERENRY